MLNSRKTRTGLQGDEPDHVVARCASAKVWLSDGHFYSLHSKIFSTHCSCRVRRASASLWMGALMLALLRTHVLFPLPFVFYPFFGVYAQCLNSFALLFLLTFPHLFDRAIPFSRRMLFFFA